MEPREAALQVFRAIQDRFPRLEMRLDTSHPEMEAALDIPEQPGMAFPVYLYVTGDILNLTCGGLWGEWFPCDDPEVCESFRAAVVGLIAGEHRIVVRSVDDDVTSARLESWDGRRWKPIYRYGSLPGSLTLRRRRTTVLRNAA